MVNNYTFDNLARMTQVQQDSQTGGNAVAPKRVDFAYDAASQWSTIKRYANLAGTQLVVTSTYTFDNDSRLTALSHTKGANTLAGYTYTYDAASRITQFGGLKGSGVFVLDEPHGKIRGHGGYKGVGSLCF